MSDREKIERMYQEVLKDLAKAKKRVVQKIERSKDILVSETDESYREYKMLLEQKALFEAIFEMLDEE